MVHISGALLSKRAQKLDVIRRLASQAFKGSIYLVGGALRELALGQKPKDYDFALQSFEDIAIFESVFGAHSFLLGKKPIQTRRIVTAEISIDITALDGTIHSDLLRRDFTINAMAYDVINHRLFDLSDGLSDIELRIIRYPRKESLQDDPLRMVKAIRHLASLSGFTIDDEVKREISENRALIHKTAPERIKYEIDLIMSSPSPYKGVDMMRQTGLLFELIPELLPLGRLDQDKFLNPATLGHTIGGFCYMNRISRFYSFSEYDRRLAGYGLLFHDLGKATTYSQDETTGKVHFFYHERHSSELASSIMERLRFSSVEFRSIVSLIENHMRIFLISSGDVTERATRRIVYKMGDLCPALVFLTLLDLYGSSGGKDNTSTKKVRNRCREVLAGFEEWAKEPLPRLINGRDLLNMGFSEGPLLGRVLNDVREKQISGEMTTQDEALAYAKVQPRE